MTWEKAPREPVYALEVINEMAKEATCASEYQQHAAPLLRRLTQSKAGSEEGDTRMTAKCSDSNPSLQFPLWIDQNTDTVTS
jgi:hypothetical protein